jgi:hypothetical protein
MPVSGFNRLVIVLAAFPLTATMDQGTNTIYNAAGMNTWFGQGYAAAAAGYPDSGLPHPGVGGHDQP